MRDVSERFLSAVQGSNAPRVTANIWLDGRVVREGVRVVGGHVSSSASGIVESSVSLQFAETVSVELGDPVHAYGMQVNVLAGFDLEGSEELVSVGWFEIKEVTVADNWVWPAWLNQLPTDEQSALKMSTVYSLEGQDFMSVVAESEFLAPLQPKPAADAWTTINELCAGIVSVLDPQFEAKSLPAGLIFEWSRLEAIKQIAKLWDGAYPVITSDGQLTLTTDSLGDTVADFGAGLNIEQWTMAFDSRGLKNAVTFMGRTPAGEDLLGYAVEDAGALRYGGPFGFRPTRQSSDLMDTQAKVDAAAATALQTMISRRTVSQDLSALWNPALELRDRNRLVLPDESWTARVTGFRLPLLGGPMGLTVEISDPVKVSSSASGEPGYGFDYYGGGGYGD